MTHLEIREKFLDFFKKHGHKVVPSSSLLPDDPSVLFTTAGMQQFKPYYLGQKSPYGNRVASVQKSIRTIDIEEVGDNSHVTFIEMLGNFSFNYPEGDSSYFKKEAIEFGYNFIVKELGISPDRIKISVFKGDESTPFDEESFKIWKDLGIPDDTIVFLGREDNFWGPTGDKGPCGPTTEIYVDDIEVWNIVFNEYFCEPKEKGHEKHLTPLAQRGVDTGMGLERLAMVLNNKKSIYDTDLFVPLVTEIRGKKLKDSKEHEKSERIIADHIKAAVFIIAGGVLPSNTEQGYILRRLLRRAILHCKKLQLPEDIYGRLVHVIGHDVYKNIYPEIEKKQKEILNIIIQEKYKFEKTLKRGLKIFEKNLKESKNISGSQAFQLYSTYGFPIELTRELARDKGLDINEKEFEKELEKHKEISRAGVEKKFGGHGLVLDTGEIRAGDKEELKTATRLHTATHLLHAALRKTFGDSVQQRGSDVTAERFRFDFSFPRKITKEELEKVEGLVNEIIKKDYEVICEEMSYKEAIKNGALAFFRGKYPDRVSVYTIRDPKTSEVFSKEVCGGPHVKHTGEIGKFIIKKEQSVGAGIRRIRATVE